MRCVLGSAALLAAALSLEAQTFTVLDSFSSTQGPYARAGLVQGLDGNLYGAEGGGNYVATVLKITPEGAMTTLSTFPIPRLNFTAGLVQATNGSLYGVTPGVEYTTDAGDAYQISSTGEVSVVAALSEDPVYPVAGLIQAWNGYLYGTTSGGGTYDLGTFFRMTPEGVVTTLYSFCGENCTHGGWDPTGGLVQGTNGDFYGVTYAGGNDFDTGTGYGTVFQVTASGSLTTLYRFCHSKDCPDGNNPTSLLQATDGNFYGTTISGGAQTFAGTIFKFTPSGALTTLYSFCSASNCTDGYQPQPALIQASDGNFYGTTNSGGLGYYGTIFRLTPAGALTTLYSFCSQPGCADGYAPATGLVQATNGDFYGVASGGGVNGLGTLFRLSLGLAPFVKTMPVAGTAGETVEVLGTGLTGATGVVFSGVQASFRVASDSLIVATVPAGASTGTVAVAAPGRTLLSNVPFQVLP